jgi:hypothetical protein
VSKVDPEAVQATAAVLRAAADELGIVRTADDRVSEESAAVLIGYSAKTLRNMRSEALGPPFFQLACGGSKVSYRVRELAEWVESRRVDP